MGEAVKHSLKFLLSEHDELSDVFNNHQRALIMRDIDGAVAMLTTFQNALNRHIAYEDEVLLPLYAAKHAETEGATLPIFHAEHAKLRQMCAKLAQDAINLYDSCDILGSILKLLDEEALFKGLFTHHAQRETSLLFPRLDACTTEFERVKAMEMH